jgi:hypothetical protein
MLARLRDAITPPSAPSALLVVGEFSSMIRVLHLIPEDGAIERFNQTNLSATFRRPGAREQAREQIGTVTVYAGDGETATNLLDDVEIRARKLWNDSLSSSPALVQMTSGETTHLVQNILKLAALDAIRVREGRPRSLNATQTHPVFVVRITRSRAGRILTGSIQASLNESFKEKHIEMECGVDARMQHSQTTRSFTKGFPVLSGATQADWAYNSRICLPLSKPQILLLELMACTAL